VEELRRGWVPYVFLGVLDLPEPTVGTLSWGLAAVAAQLEAYGWRADGEAACRRRRILQDQLAGSGGLRRAAGLLRDMQVTPLTTLRAPDNTYATAPLRVDALAAEAWDPIFNPAKGGRPLERIAAYFAHIKEGAIHNQEFPLPAWDVDEFLCLLNQAPDRAAGLDAMPVDAGVAPPSWSARVAHPRCSARACPQGPPPHPVRTVR
jgi:hypothetical protein